MIVQNLDSNTTEYTDIALVFGCLEQLLRELLKVHWCQVIFGPYIRRGI
ncbi:MAG: hypothetical protein HYZ50_04960 [Deltaproteobacteria bacterium]|nr:hypothetical protein [Deltaproteobacteria bacterium]